MIFASRTPELIHKQLLSMNELIKFLREECGVYAYICYGTLLGAVRNNDVIPHDNDYDIAYLSNGTNLKEVRQEAIEIANILMKYEMLVKTWTPLPVVVDKNTQEFKTLIGQMHVLSPKKDIVIDVFTSWIQDGKYYLIPLVKGKFSPNTIVPFTQKSIKDIKFNAPKNSNFLLKYFYGDDWNIPMNKKTNIAWKRLTDYKEDVTL